MTSRPAIRAVLFDKDGTLLDYEKTWSALNRAAALLAADGDPLLAARLLEVGGVDPATGTTRPDSLLAASTNREIAEGWVAAGSGHPVDGLAAALDDLFTAGAARAVPVTDLEPLFARLRRAGFALGIASSDSEAAIRAMAAAFGLEAHVACMIGYDSGHGVKPGPGMLLRFCAVTGVEPEGVAVVGDNLHDMEMARAGGAGLRIAVLTGTGEAAALAAAADLVLASIADLEAHLMPDPARHGAVSEPAV